MTRASNLLRTRTQERSPMEMPRGMWLRAWVPPWVVMLSIVVYGAGLVVVMIPGMGWRIGGAVSLGALALGAPIASMVAMYRMRRARARAHWYRLCPKCRGDLRLCEPEGGCPGCGQAYTPESLLKHWEGTDAKSAAAKRWRPLSARAVISPALIMGVAPMLVGLVAAFVLVKLGVLPPQFAMLVFIAVGPTTGLLGSWVAKRDRRDFEAIERAGFMTCPECVATLAPPSDAERGEACCGGCGQQYSMPWLVQTWTGSYAHVLGFGVGKDGKPAWNARQGMDLGSRRLAIGFGVAALLCVAVIAMLNPFVGFTSLPPAAMIAMAAAMVVGVLVFTGIMVKRSGYHYTRMIRLRAHGYRFCPECGYDLRESAAEGTCPECGVGYDGESLRTRWERGARVEPPAL